VKGFNVFIKLATFSLIVLAFILVEAWYNAHGKIKTVVMKAIRHLEYSGVRLLDLTGKINRT
jgi:hypothetical protein